MRTFKFTIDPDEFLKDVVGKDAQGRYFGGGRRTAGGFEVPVGFLANGQREDGPKRDRLVWIGDLHPETMTVATVFGNQPIVPASLDLIRDETPLPKWMNGISSYSMWWVLIHRDWYRHQGDVAQDADCRQTLSDATGPITIRRQRIHQRGRIDTARGHGLDAAVGTRRHASVGVQHVQVIRVDRQVDGIVQFGDLPAEEEV